MNATTALSPEVVAKIRHVILSTNRVLKGQLLGQSRSSKKGMGFDFEALRDYQIGDDVRFIDWSASSRTQNLLVREFRQEQSKTVLLVVDVSASSTFGSQVAKKELMTQIASAIALVGLYANDAVGLLLYSDRVELYMPPSRSKQHIHTIMQKLLSWEHFSSATDSRVAWQHLLHMRTKDALLFWVTDAIDAHLTTVLPQLVPLYDLYLLRCCDVRERSLPTFGSVCVHDSELKSNGYMHMNRAASQFLQVRLTEQQNAFSKAGVKMIEVTDLMQSIDEMVRLFNKRLQA